MPQSAITKYLLGNVFNKYSLGGHPQHWKVPVTPDKRKPLELVLQGAPR
jgi:hypothetical protein